ncbi:unnamed protein product [Mesocestoides corti]|uniref:CARD domain-containing protein n=1 Tax=Mesocestoides corti TaxID=53468 RepID=A0A158QUZ5_MESCO|nr:unnamed protein product [Mesocestoides corti]
MDSNKLDALTKCYPALVQSLSTVDILDHLIAGGHVSRDECERILHEVTSTGKVRLFLDTLLTKSNEAFECFHRALSEKQPFLARILEDQLAKAPCSKGPQSSLTDILQTLLHGAVPDRPTAYINRPQTIAKLTDGFRWLGTQFSPPPTNRQFGSLDVDSTTLPDIPTNAWFLVYGPPGQGKSVMTAAVLRQNSQLLTDMFSGGVIWLRVGEKKDVELSQQVMEVLSALTEHVTALPSQSRPFKNSSDERKEIYRPNDSDVNRMTSYLHNLLITRQYRRAQVSNHQSLAPASLLLIVLDDVWDDFIVSALSTLPAAFVVTSRDMNILQRVSTRVRRLWLCDCLHVPVCVWGRRSATALSSEGSPVPGVVFFNGIQEFRRYVKAMVLVLQECIEADLKDDDVALLMSIRAAISRECFLGPGALHADIPSLCRGSPLAASLLGGLLSSPTFNLSRYLDPRGSRNSKGEIIIDWSKVKYPSWYTYESVEESITASLTRLSEIELERYRQFVIFQDDCPLTEDVSICDFQRALNAALSRLCAPPPGAPAPLLSAHLIFFLSIECQDSDTETVNQEVFAIYWSCTNQEALDLLQRLHRFSLIQCKWEIGMGRSVFSLPNLQLDLLRSTIPTSQQQARLSLFNTTSQQYACHCQFIDNYKACFGEHWAQLADFKLIHTYFCRSVGEHMLKAGRLAGLIDLLTDLKFICARLLVLGSSAVVADFRRFQPVFQEFGRLNDWYMYLHFLQTTAYQLINPDRVVRELHRHARSPTRPGSLCDMSSAPRRGAVGAEHCRQSMTPDAFAASHHSSPSPPTFRAAAASAVRARADVVDRHRYSVRLPRKDLMVKGLDLLQLGLMFPPDNAVFQQSLSLLGAGDAAVGLKQNVAVAPKYYWFWSNSSSTGSELVWATRTGKDKITAIAAEADYSLLPPSLRRRTKPSEDRSINRRFVGTSDGRIIILDVTSGYEVAVHQVHKPSVAVVAISLLPGNQSCLSCGADGRMIVSTLPPLDASVMSPNGGSIFCRSNHMGDLSGPGPDDSYFTTIDVDDDYPEMSPASNLNDDDTFYDVSGGSSPTHPSSPLADCAGGLPAAPRSASPVLQEDPFPTYTVAPTVLADLPSSFEIRRNTQESTSLAPHQAVDSGVHDDDTATQQCIALSPLGTCLLFSDQPNPNSPTADMTLRRRRILDDSLVPSPPEQNPISLTIYSVLAQSQCKFTLVKSRELTLPPQLGERSTQVTVATASISLDDSLIITGLSNGRLWIFSLDEIGWVTCIASAVALMADPFFAAPMSTRTPRPRPESSPLDLISSYCDPELMKLALVDGKVAKTCIFIHWPNQAQAPVNPGGWNPPVNPLVAAAIDNLVLVSSVFGHRIVGPVCFSNYTVDFLFLLTSNVSAYYHFVCQVWSFENKLPDGIDDLQNPETIVPASRAQFCLPCPPAVAITALDSQSFGSRCFLAAGLTNGHAIVSYFLIWSLPELCKVFDVCAHCTPVTSVRLSPYGYCRSPAATPTSPSHRPLSINTLSPAATSDLVSVTTAAEDGVVKAWEFPWSNSKEPQSMNMSLILSAESSPSRNRRQTLEQSVRVEACAREQPFPLWADVFSVVFGLRGEFYAVGRIKASCSLQVSARDCLASTVCPVIFPMHLNQTPSALQILFRKPVSVVGVDGERGDAAGYQSFQCVELSLSLCHGRSLAQAHLPVVSGSPVEQSSVSAFQLVNRVVTNNPVPSCAAFSADLKLLAIGFENGTVQVRFLPTHFPAIKFASSTSTTPYSTDQKESSNTLFQSLYWHFQVLRMNVPRDPLSGFKPYRKLTVFSRNSISDSDCSGNNGRPGTLNRDLPFEIVSTSMKITHLSLWTPPSNFEDPDLELVVAVITAGGNVHVSRTQYCSLMSQSRLLLHSSWPASARLARLTDAVSTTRLSVANWKPTAASSRYFIAWAVWEVNSSQAQDDLSCNGGKLAPFKRWPRMHLPTPPSAPAATANRPIAPPSLGRPFSPDPWSPTRHPVVWFNCYPNLQPLQKHQAWRARLAWLSAGLDGMLCGRSLSDEWSLSLVAHKPAEITDVDVDPHGRWIATASTDCTVRVSASRMKLHKLFCPLLSGVSHGLIDMDFPFVKFVWCLLTERKVFEGSHKPSVVRCVRFRPITKAIDVGIEMLLASGDADGNLRVWRLTAPKSDDLSMIASRSTISSDAAGCGGSGFVCLAWSADGGTLAGLSDRLCSWRILVRPGGGGNQQQQQQQQLDRSRVIRVFDTTALRNRLFVSRASPGNPNLPPTMITLEAQSGVCFVFDPIEMLGLWGGVGGCVGPSTVVLSDVTSILNKQHKPVN